MLGEGDAMLDPFDEVMIKNYFSLSLTIKQLQQYKHYIRQEFYAQNMATRSEPGELEMITKGFRPDREVENLILRTDVIEQRISRNLYRKKKFNQFLEQLPGKEMKLLERCFEAADCIDLPLSLTALVLDEINEIETAICYREGLEPSEFEDCETLEDVQTNLERVCDFFAL